MGADLDVSTDVVHTTSNPDKGSKSDSSPDIKANAHTFMEECVVYVDVSVGSDDAAVNVSSALHSKLAECGATVVLLSWTFGLTGIILL